jgi:PAS domain S-box-containing protein
MGGDPPPVHVLHVDEDSSFVEAAAALLEREDDRVAVETATDASEGLDRIADGAFDCVVSDYEMPGRNGIEFLDAVREDHPDLPFILYTGKGSEAVASDAISAGVTDYLQKQGGTSQYAVLANRVTNAVEQYRSQRELEASQQRLSLFIDQSPLGVIEWDEKFRLRSMNDAAEAILGYRESDLRGESWEAIVPEEERDAVDAVVTDLLENRGGHYSRNENVRKDGERVTCEWHNRAVTDGDEVVAIFSQFQDITERMRRRRAVEELHSTTRSVMRAETADAVADIVVGALRDILDMSISGVFLYEEEVDALMPAAWTERSEEICDGVPTFERGGSLAWEVFETGDRQVHDDVSTVPGRYNEETVVRGEIVLPLGDHGVVLVGSTDAGAFDETDVSLARTLAAHATAALDRVEHEQVLKRQNDRLEEFASIVSHDLRNPLNVAEGRLELAREDRDSEHLRAVAEAHERMAALIDDLLTLARGDAATDIQPVHLGEMVPQCWQTIDAAGATLAVEAAGTVRADRGQLKQLLENLLQNAVEHGGDDVAVTVGSTEGGFYVADDGPGVPEEERERVFDPGVSTDDRGTGFGLTIVTRVAEAHGWTVSVTESDAGGARFEVAGVDRP